MPNNVRFKANGRFLCAKTDEIFSASDCSSKSFSWGSDTSILLLVPAYIGINISNFEYNPKLLNKK